jgi:hypothetical protein
MQQEIGLQSRSKSLTFRARVRHPLSLRRIVCSCRGQRSGPSHDLRACITIDVAADPRCDQIDGLAPARAELGTPPDQRAGHNPVCGGGLRNDCAGAARFQALSRASASVKLQRRLRAGGVSSGADAAIKMFFRPAVPLALSLALVLIGGRTAGARAVKTIWPPDSLAALLTASQSTAPLRPLTAHGSGPTTPSRTR